MMGNRTKKLNYIKEQKNHIARAYSALCKNNSSYFDALITKYGKDNLQKIVTVFGERQFGKIDPNNFSQQMAIQVAQNAYGQNYLPMTIYSSNFTEKDGKYTQQVYVCLANKNRVDRKRRFGFDDFMQNLKNHDIVLVDVKQREIIPSMSLVLNKIDNKQYDNQIVDLLLCTMPTADTICKTQNAIIMQNIKKDSPKLYAELVDFDKKIAQTLFLYQTSKEQLLLNDALEEFESNLWSMPVETVNSNFAEIKGLKSKADKIEAIMSKNGKILNNLSIYKPETEEKNM